MMIESQIGFSTFLVSIREERYALTRGLLNAGMTKALAECNNDVYKSLFISKGDRKKQEEEEAANFCARGIVPSLSRSTKFGLG